MHTYMYRVACHGMCADAGSVVVTHRPESRHRPGLGDCRLPSASARASTVSTSPAVSARSPCLAQRLLALCVSGLHLSRADAAHAAPSQAADAARIRSSASPRCGGVAGSRKRLLRECLRVSGASCCAERRPSLYIACGAASLSLASEASQAQGRGAMAGTGCPAAWQMKPHRASRGVSGVCVASVPRASRRLAGPGQGHAGYGSQTRRDAPPARRERRDAGGGRAAE